MLVLARIRAPASFMRVTMVASRRGRSPRRAPSRSGGISLVSTWSLSRTGMQCRGPVSPLEARASSRAAASSRARGLRLATVFSWAPAGRRRRCGRGRPAPGQRTTVHRRGRRRGPGRWSPLRPGRTGRAGGGGGGDEGQDAWAEDAERDGGTRREDAIAGLRLGLLVRIMRGVRFGGRVCQPEFPFCNPCSHACELIGASPQAQRGDGVPSRQLGWRARNGAIAASRSRSFRGAGSLSASRGTMNA